MANKFHINDKGEARVCQAKPGNCRFGISEEEHYSSKDEAQEQYETRQSMMEALAATVRTESVHTDQAVTSGLPGFTGSEPKWFKSMKKQFAALHPNVEPPVIIDTLTIEGRKAAVVWSVESTDEGIASIVAERGYSMPQIDYVDATTGKAIGFARVSYVTDESFTRSFKDDQWSSFRFYEDFNGDQTGVMSFAAVGDDYEDIDLSEQVGDDASRLAFKQNVWLKSHQALSMVPERLKQAGVYAHRLDEHVPDDERILDADLGAVREKMDEAADRFKQNNRIPHIDFIRVNDQYRNKGLGHSLYVYLARQLGSEKNQVLSSSSIQTEHAQRSWKRMAADSRIPVGVITTSYATVGRSGGEENTKKTARYFIDYRPQSTAARKTGH